jgi:hypothetical protein
MTSAIHSAGHRQRSLRSLYQVEHFWFKHVQAVEKDLSATVAVSVLSEIEEISKMLATLISKLV